MSKVIQTKTCGRDRQQFSVKLADHSKIIVTVDDTVEIRADGPVIVESGEQKLIDAIENGKVIERTNMASALNYQPLVGGTQREWQLEKLLLGRTQWVEVATRATEEDVLNNEY